MATQTETATETAAQEAAVKEDPFLATFDEDTFDEEVFVAPPEEEKEGEEEEEEVKKGCFGRKKKKPVAKAPSVPFWKLYKFSSRIERLMIFVGLVCGFIHGALLPAFTIFFGDTLQSFGDVGSPGFDPDAALQSVVDVSLNFVWLGIAAFVTGLFQVYLVMMASQRQARRIRTMYMKALLSQEMAWYDEVDSAELAQRVHGDVQKIEDGTGDKVSSALQFVAMFLVGFIIGFIYGWQMTLVILAITPILAAAGSFFAKMSADAVTEGQTAYAKAGAIAQESFSLIRIVAAYALENSEIKRYGEALKVAVKKGYRKALFMGLGLGLTMFVILSSYGLAFWYGNRLVNSEPPRMEPGNVITVFFSVIIGAMALGQASPSINAISEAMGAAPKVYEVIARQSEIDAFSTEGVTSAEVKGRIEIKDVDFTYRARQDRLVLNKLNLTIEAGTTVALVGESGCGKSTTIQLLERFYDPKAGSVTLDGTDLKDYNVQWLRGQMGFVQQMPVLFAMSIRENIELGAGVTVSKDDQGNQVVEHMQVSEEDVIAAAKMANAHEFIKKLPKGYDTQIGARGAQLSGGQKQRIAIARALVRNPRILLLDEATSALDTQSERQVQQAIEKAQEGRTTVVIAHRLSTIRNADKIAVFVDGEVQELGTHEELMEIENGVYKNLVNLQNISSEQDKESLTTQIADQKSTTKGSVTQKSGGDTVTGVKETEDSEEEPTVDKKKTKAATRRAIAMSKDDLLYIIPGCFGAVLSGLVWPVFSLIFTKIIVVLVSSSDPGEVRKWALTFFGIGCGALISNFLQLWLLGVAGERLTCRLREMLFKALIRQDVGFFDLRENSVGILTARLGGDAAKVKGATGERLGNFVMIGSTMLCGIIIAFQACWRVALVVLATVPLFAIGGMIQMQMMSGLSGELSKLFANANTIASTSVDCIQTVTSLGAGDRFIDDYDKELGVPAKAGKRKALTAGLAFGFTEFAMFGIWALTFWYGTRITEFCDFEGMLTALTALIFSAMTLGQVAALMPDAADAGAAAAKIFDIIDRPSPVDPLSEEGEKLETCDGNVRLDNVVFRYPARPEVTVLKGLSVEAEKGKTLALVGPSGSGKSTVALLTERFYDAYSGVVSIDGKPITSLNVGSFRDHIGFVTQEPELFSTTIRENIMHGLPKQDEEGTVVTEEQIVNAAKLANAHKFIMKLPEGYDTNVGAHGGQLSGGQRQRIAIARAVVRDPRILLLDEATSALDSDSEKVVQAALDKAASGRTTIVIAHRLSTIRNAHTIVVVADGNIREKGTHDQLVQIPNGIYAGLVKQQTL